MRDHALRAEAGAKAVQHGRLMAAALAGAWRSSPPALPLSPAGVSKITPLLIRSGTAGLAWWRSRQSDLKDAEGFSQLHDAYRYDTLQAAIHESRIKKVFALLREADVEPVLVKGWAIARLYPQRALRPYGDIDLCIRPGRYSDATAALAGRAVETGVVDLHKGLPELYRQSLDEVYDRSQLVPLADMEVRILGPEDHLRYMCIHMLRHGVYRALWLCDIAVALESRPQSLDWEYLLSGDRRRTSWVVGALGLAHQLLGARLDGTPVASRAKNLPRWLVPAVLRQWGTAEHYIGSRPMSVFLRRPKGVLKALRLRWPNPIQATVRMRGPFNQVPRLPFQLGECLLRTANFVTQLPGLVRGNSTQ